VCKKHKTMEFLMHALRKCAVLPAAGAANSCACDFCGDGEGAQRLKDMCSSLAALAAAALCPKILFAAKEEAQGLSAATAEYMHYAHKCVSNACTVCSNAEKMPKCAHIRQSSAPAAWFAFETITAANGVRHNDQVVEKRGTVAELWGRFVEFFHKEYVPHNSIARLQQHNFTTCLATFETDTVVCTADFAEKYTHTSTVELTCQTKPKTTLMILVAHVHPRNEPHPQTGTQQRTHDSVAYVVVSDDELHDAEFHRHALRMITCDIQNKYSDILKPLKKLVLWTDGCASQYKGKRNFKFVSAADRELNIVGLDLAHNFFAASHGKG